jgi:glycerol dehydrogenase
MTKNSFNPGKVLTSADQVPPRVLSAPQKYIQGAGVLNCIGQYINGLMRVDRAAIFASRRGLATQGTQIAGSLQAHSIDVVNAQFNGECSQAEIALHSDALADQQLDCLIAVGGGKVADAGKCIAHRLNISVIVVPTLASTDAPCSALSVVYKPEGTAESVEFFPQNPAMVVVDTDVIVSASERYFVAGIGDAMATWYEAKVCLDNPSARNSLGALPTLASCAMGEMCAQTLFEYGEMAAASVLLNQNNTAVDKVIEANTLLSGIGFESGGLALAHAIALAYPEIEFIHDHYLHGEMVAMGTLAQLAMEDSGDAERVTRFFARIGLPVHFAQISFEPDNLEAMNKLIEATLARPIAHNMPMPVTKDSLTEAFFQAHELGLKIATDEGSEAYTRLHA